MSVLDYGRMAVLADPTGAVFGIWQPGVNKGDDRRSRPDRRRPRPLGRGLRGDPAGSIDGIKLGKRVSDIDHTPVG
jgi:hypothetical protein